MPSDKQPQSSKGHSAKWNLGGKGYVPHHHQSRTRPKESAPAKQMSRSTPSRSRAAEGRDNPQKRATTKPSVVHAKAASTLRYMNTAQLNVQREFMAVTGTDSNTHEVRYRITEFFDIAAETKILDYWWAYQQSLTASGGPSGDFNSSGRVWSRPLKAKLYVLPRSDPAKNATSSFCISSGIPLKTAIDGTDRFTIAGTGSKVIQPNYNIQWTHVATFDYEKTFSNSLVVPYTNTAGDAICLFQAAAVDIDSGDNFASAVQCMIVLDVAQNVPAMCQVEAGTSSTDTWGYPGDPEVGFIDSQFALVQPTGFSNRS